MLSVTEVIRLVVMMYILYPLSLRQVEDILFERGIEHGGEASIPVGGLMPNYPLGAGFGLLRLEFLAYDVENVEGQYGREKAPNGGERIIEK